VQIIASDNNLIGQAFEAATDMNVSNTFQASHALYVIVLALPIILVSLCDTGLLYSLVGALCSAALGFRRGVGSVK